MANDESFIGGVPFSQATGNKGPSADELDMKASGLKIDGTAMTADAADLNILDGADTAGLVAADLAELAGAAANGLVAADLTKLAGVTASAAELNRTTSIVSHILTVACPGTFGVDTGGGGTTRGMRLGIDAADSVNQVEREDNSAGTFTDETADATNDGTGDVTLTQPFDTNDAIYIGLDEQFDCLLTDVSTAGAGDAVASETVWEYYNGSSWASLTTFTDPAGAFAATGNNYLTFAPPSDWATTTIDGGSALYFLRLRATADNVYNTTEPIIDRLVPFQASSGVPSPVTGTISQVDMHAETASGSTANSVFVITNITQATYDTITWTKQQGFARDNTVSLAVTAGDQLAIRQVTEDGSTEFADGTFYMKIDL